MVLRLHGPPDVDEGRDRPRVVGDVRAVCGPRHLDSVCDLRSHRRRWWSGRIVRARGVRRRPAPASSSSTRPCSRGTSRAATGSRRARSTSIGALGLENELKAFNRVDKLRVNGAGRTLTFDWPASDNVPRPRLRRRAHRPGRAAAPPRAERGGRGARRRVGRRRRSSRTAPSAASITKHNGTTEELRAPVVIAADGASSRVARARRHGARPEASDRVSRCVRTSRRSVRRPTTT